MPRFSRYAAVALRAPINRRATLRSPLPPTVFSGRKSSSPPAPSRFASQPGGHPDPSGEVQCGVGREGRNHRKRAQQELSSNCSPSPSRHSPSQYLLNRRLPLCRRVLLRLGAEKRPVRGGEDQLSPATPGIFRGSSTSPPSPTPTTFQLSAQVNITFSRNSWSLSPSEFVARLEVEPGPFESGKSSAGVPGSVAVAGERPRPKRFPANKLISLDPRADQTLHKV